MHIGKSSAGWVFSLRVYRNSWDNGPENWEDWLAEIVNPSNAIWDEYGNRISAEAMIDCVTNRGDGLRRHHDMPDVEHGPGTYDYINTEYS